MLRKIILSFLKMRAKKKLNLNLKKRIVPLRIDFMKTEIQFI